VIGFLIIASPLALLAFMFIHDMMTL